MVLLINAVQDTLAGVLSLLPNLTRDSSIPYSSPMSFLEASESFSVYAALWIESSSRVIRQRRHPFIYHTIQILAQRNLPRLLVNEPQVLFWTRPIDIFPGVVPCHQAIFTDDMDFLHIRIQFQLARLKVKKGFIILALKPKPVCPIEIMSVSKFTQTYRGSAS